LLRGFISLLEDRGKVGGKVRIRKDEKVKTLYFNHRNGIIDYESVVKYLLGAMSDASEADAICVPRPVQGSA
jgi:hypothetical protein